MNLRDICVKLKQKIYKFPPRPSTKKKNKYCLKTRTQIPYFTWCLTIKILIHYLKRNYKNKMEKENCVKINNQLLFCRLLNEVSFLISWTLFLNK